MKRRQFLYGVTGLAIWPTCSMALGPTSVGIGKGTSDLTECLLQACPRRSSAVAVGNAYLSSLRSPLEISQAVDHLMGKLQTSPSELAAMTRAQLTARLRARTSEDFSAGRTIGLRGWVLSETEAELCGLAALHSGWDAG